MKLAVLVAAAAQAKSSSWLKKEWEVQDAYFADEEIILSDLSIRDGSRRKYRIYLQVFFATVKAMVAISIAVICFEAFMQVFCLGHQVQLN